MQVRIEEIRDEGLELNEPVPQTLLDETFEGVQLGFRPERSTPFHARLEKIGRRVRLKGDLTVEGHAPCKRCLDQVPVKLEPKFEMTFVPAELISGPAEGEPADDGVAAEVGTFELGRADDEPFDGKTIPLDPVVREQVLLALPVSVLCQEDCRGLCPVCGQELNVRECGCERKVLDPRLAALKDIKLN